MKNRKLRIAFSILLVLAASCDEPETVVTDIVHRDGSVTRRIEMKCTENDFSAKEIQVPFDTTWTVRDSLEIDEKGDTTWVKRAEKYFSTTDLINIDYKHDSSANRESSRRVVFSRKFKWFNTEFRFAELIDETLKHGYPVDDFLNQEELAWYYAPLKFRDEKLNGSDSLKYKTLSDSVEAATEKWIARTLVSEWTGVFSELLGNEGTGDLSPETLKSDEDKFYRIMITNESDFDSLWANGNILKSMIGEENGLKYFSEADSAVNIVLDRLLITFSDYTMKIVMPGRVIETNGFRDNSPGLQWRVMSDFFLTEPYEMRAVSRIQNWWAWVLSGIFVLFVMTGIMINKKRKGRI